MSQGATDKPRHVLSVKGRGGTALEWLLMNYFNVMAFVLIWIHFYSTKIFANLNFISLRSTTEDWMTWPFVKEVLYTVEILHPGRFKNRAQSCKSENFPSSQYNYHGCCDSIQTVVPLFTVGGAAPGFVSGWHHHHTLVAVRVKAFQRWKVSWNWAVCQFFFLCYMTPQKKDLKRGGMTIWLKGEKHTTTSMHWAYRATFLSSLQCLTLGYGGPLLQIMANKQPKPSDFSITTLRLVGKFNIHIITICSPEEP